MKTFGRGGHARTRAASSSRGGSSSNTASAASGSATCFRIWPTCVDDIAFLHSMTADSPIHGSAMLQMNTGKILSRQPVPRLVGQLRPGEREREPARLRRDARSARRADQRRQELVERLHAGHLPGDDLALRRRRRSSTWQRPERHDAKPPSADCSTRLRDYNDEHQAPRGRQQQPGRPDRQLRAGVQDAAARPRGGRSRARRRETTQELYGLNDKRHRATSAAAACWPGGWSSAACASSRSTPAAPTTTTTGTPTATW